MIPFMLLRLRMNGLPRRSKCELTRNTGSDCSTDPYLGTIPLYMNAAHPLEDYALATTYSEGAIRASMSHRASPAFKLPVTGSSWPTAASALKARTSN